MNNVHIFLSIMLVLYSLFFHEAGHFFTALLLGYRPVFVFRWPNFLVRWHGKESDAWIIHFSGVILGLFPRLFLPHFLLLKVVVLFVYLVGSRKDLMVVWRRFRRVS